MTVITIDVSHHDEDRHGGPLDWVKIRASGISVMCAKVTEGDPGGSYHYADPSGPRNVANATAAGLVTGVYHCLSHGDAASIARQVDWLASVQAKTGADWAMIDVEPFDELKTRGIAPKISDVNAFCARWAAVTGRPLAVYLPHWYWEQLGSPSLAAVKILVSSDYGTNADGTPTQLYASRGGDAGRGWAAYGGVVPALWQFSSNANVPGASGQTDANASRGTLAELTALLIGDDVSTQDVVDGLNQTIDFRSKGVADAAKAVGMTGKSTRELVEYLFKAVVLDAPARDAALSARLDAILAAASDDGDVTVQMDDAARAELTAIRDALSASAHAAAAKLDETAA
jgi:GH25 family lysozyme M1 (1,4-beta-N-acetylmuramidase)